VNQGFSSNVQGALTHPVADATTQLTLQLGRTWVTPHSSFVLDYVPQGLHYARYNSLDYIAQSLQQSWQYAATSHTSLAWTSSFQQFPERGGPAQMGAPGALGLQSASQAQQAGTFLTSGTSSFSVQRQSSLRASWSAQFNAAWQGYRQDAPALAPGAAAQESSQTKSAGAQLGWSYLLTPSRSVSVSASDSDLWFTLPVQHRRYTSLETSLTQRWGATSLQVGGGPAWNAVVSSAVPAAGRDLGSWAGSAGLSQAIGKAELGLTWNHRVQAGLTPASISTDDLALQFQQQWGRWQGSASLGSTRMASIVAGEPARSGLFASTQMSYALASWSVEANCNYYSQDLAVASGGLQTLNRIQASLGIRYAWQGAR
jgi:hypothetical protein